MNTKSIVSALLDSDVSDFVDAALGFGSVLSLNPLGHQKNWGQKHYHREVQFRSKHGDIGGLYVNARDDTTEGRHASLRVVYHPLSLSGSSVGTTVDFYVNMRDVQKRLIVVNALRHLQQEADNLKVEYAQKEVRHHSEACNRLATAMRELVTAFKEEIKPVIVDPTSPVPR